MRGEKGDREEGGGRGKEGRGAMRGEGNEGLQKEGGGRVSKIKFSKSIK